LPPSWEFARKPFLAGARGITEGARGFAGRSYRAADRSGRLLNKEQEQSIQQAIETKSPPELGITSALWTRQAVQELIKQQVGIRLPSRTVGEYLRRWGYTPQKPVRQSLQARSPGGGRMAETTYPEIERRAEREGGEIHWGDETGVRSTCQHSRGYAHPGETPELIVPGNRFSVNMIATITNQGKVRWMITRER